jgi:hypothetical protein
MSGAALANAASKLVGVPFRLQGRNPATGLDCIGVLAASLHAAGRPANLPRTYRLKTLRPIDADTWANASGLESASGPAVAGDVLLVRVSACQFHLLIALEPRLFVHAHAGLRRVVRHDGTVPWPIVGHWRLTKEERS